MHRTSGHQHYPYIYRTSRNISSQPRHPVESCLENTIRRDIDMDGGFGARCYHIDDSTAATGLLSRRRKLRVKREPYPLDYNYDNFSDFRSLAGGSRLDSDDDGWLAYEAPLLRGKRRCTAVSSSAAAVNPVRHGHVSQAAKRLDQVVLNGPMASATATPPNACPAAGTVPPPPVSAAASAAPAPSVPPNVGRAAPPVTGVVPRTSSSLFAFDESAALYATWVCASIMWRFVNGGPHWKICIRSKGGAFGEGHDLGEVRSGHDG